jgi:hypothetical protein
VQRQDQSPPGRAKKEKAERKRETQEGENDISIDDFE